MKMRLVMIICIIGLVGGIGTAREFDDMPYEAPAKISPLQEYDRHLILVAEFDSVVEDPEELVQFFARRNISFTELGKGGWNRAELAILKAVCKNCDSRLCCILRSLAEEEVESGKTVAITMDTLFWTVEI